MNHTHDKVPFWKKHHHTTNSSHSTQESDKPDKSHKDKHKANNSQCSNTSNAFDHNGDDLLDKVTDDDVMIKEADLDRNEKINFSDYQEAFIAVDSNFDGKITMKELQEAFGKLGHNVSDEDVTRMIQGADSDNNGTVEYEEFVELMKRYRSTKLGREKNSDEEAYEVFKAFDHNGDDLLDFNEIKSTMIALGEKVTDDDVMIKEADLDRNGKIDFSDYREAFNAVDSNFDGKITMKELQEAFGKLGHNVSDEDVTRMIQGADSDNNGTVEYEEFVELLKRYRPTKLEKEINSDEEAYEAFKFMVNTEYLPVYDYVYRRNFSNFPLTKNNFPYLLKTFQCKKDDEFILRSDGIQGSVVNQCRFCPVTNYSHIALLAKNDGDIMLLNTELSGPTAVIQNFKAHTGCILDAHWIGHDHIIIPGGLTIKYLNLNTKQVVSTFKGNFKIARALTIQPNHTNIFASSSEDGSIHLWDINSKTKCWWRKLHNQLDLPTCGASPIKMIYGSSIVFANENIIVSGGICDGKLKLFDIRNINQQNPQPVKTIIFSEKTINSPVCLDLIVNRRGRMLFAFCQDGSVYQYDIERDNYNIPLFQYSGNIIGTNFLKMDLSPDENYLICGSSSMNALIHHVGVDPQRHVPLEGHGRKAIEEVNMCRWCQSNPELILSTAIDGPVMIHRMKPGSRDSDYQRSPEYDIDLIDCNSGEELIYEDDNFVL